jgi:hypothetical protein
MRQRMVRVAVVGVATALTMTGTAAALTPANGGDAEGVLMTINDGPGDQTEPRVSGDLSVYTDKDFLNGSRIHYFDHLTGSDAVVPAGAPLDSDNLSDVEGHRIVFSRTRASDGKTAAMLFDTATGIANELDPQPQPIPMTRFGTTIGGNTVAFQELQIGNGDVFAYDLVSGAAANLSQSLYSDGNPSVAPAGDVIVWERCIGSSCDIFQSERSGGVWGTPAIVAATLTNERNPDTDGTTVVYNSGEDVAFRPVGGGPEAVLELPGWQQNPSISNGVMAFESLESTNAWDLYAYVIATNTLLRLTDTATVDDVLNDVSVLPNGGLRVVWAATPHISTDHDIYARTFSLPVGVVFAFDGFFTPVDNPPIVNVVKSGQSIPLKFGLGGDQGLSIIEVGYPKSQQVPCDPAAPVDGIEETVTSGASSLSYDATSDRYSYVWKTEKGWANTCRQLVLKLTDGTFHRATFKFR